MVKIIKMSLYDRHGELCDMVEFLDKRLKNGNQNCQYRFNYDRYENAIKDISDIAYGGSIRIEFVESEDSYWIE